MRGKRQATPWRFTRPLFEAATSAPDEPASRRQLPGACWRVRGPEIRPACRREIRIGSAHGINRAPCAAQAPGDQVRLELGQGRVDLPQALGALSCPSFAFVSSGVFHFVLQMVSAKCIVEGVTPRGHPS